MVPILKDILIYEGKGCRYYSHYVRDVIKCTIMEAQHSPQHTGSTEGTTKEIDGF